MEKTKTKEDEIGAFKRIVLRYTINMHWPENISNFDLYEKKKSGNMVKNDKEKTIKLD